MRIQPAVIGGLAVDAGDWLDVMDPASGELLDRTLRGSAADVDAAVMAARAASDGWRRTPVTQRSAILGRIGHLIRRDAEDLCLLESRDTGKPLAQSRQDVAVAARYFEFYAHTIEAFHAHNHPLNAGFLASSHHVPFGVTAHIIPWNYPLQIASRTIAPALAVGNCSVVKPAEEAPLSTIRLALLALEAGLPPGVLNVVPGLGEEAGAALASHPRVDHVSFTGSVEIGARVAGMAAENVVPVALELGGKSPNIIFPDANLDVAVPTVVRAFIQNAGQTCSAGSRLLVHEAVREPVLAGIAELARQLTIGPGLEDPDLGPLISHAQRSRVSAMVERVVASGVPELVRRDALDLPDAGYFCAPRIFADVDPRSEIAQEEVFGPVLATMSFATMEDAVSLANGTDYGLIAGVWTRDLRTAHTMAEEVHAGQVYINTYGAGGGVEYPFGGFKRSGYGRENGFEALLAFCQTKTVVLRVGA